MTVDIITEGARAKGYAAVNISFLKSGGVQVSARTNGSDGWCIFHGVDLDEALRRAFKVNSWESDTAGSGLTSGPVDQARSEGSNDLAVSGAFDDLLG